MFAHPTLPARVGALCDGQGALRDSAAYQASTMYYVQGETMDAIARKMNVSRSTVSRLIKHARDEGYIQFVLHPPQGVYNSPEVIIGREFGVSVYVAPISPARMPEADTSPHVLDAVSALAGIVVSGAITDGSIVGVAWGNTVAALSQHLAAKTVEDTYVVQLNGAAHFNVFHIPYVGAMMEAFGQAFSAQVVHFPVPAFFDRSSTRDAMFTERSIRAVLDLQARASLAVFGVGACNVSTPSQIFQAGYLTEAERSAVEADGVVADVCTLLLRADGSWSDIELNDRASGPTPQQLSKIPRRICVVAGRAKVRPALAALRAGVVTDLVIDECAAKELASIITA